MLWIINVEFIKARLILEAGKMEVIWSVHLKTLETSFSFCWGYLFHVVVDLFCVRWPLTGATLKKTWRDFLMVTIEIKWLVSQIFSVTNGRELAVWLLMIWSVSCNTGNYFTVKNHWLLLPSSHIFSMETNTFHDPEKAISLYTWTDVIFMVGSFGKENSVQNERIWVWVSCL